MPHMISRYMTEDHRRCDEAFSALESSIFKKNFEDIEARFATFRDDFLNHFTMEESVMFPAIEEHAGTTGGPTQVMRMEHEQMRRLMDQMEADIAKGDYDHFLGLAETFMILVQQHNMKEEQILYSMADSLLDDSREAILEAMKNAVA